MHRVNGADPGPGNTFKSGDPQASTPATEVTDEWLTSVQEEIVAPVEAAGIPLSTADNGQLLQAINLMARFPGLFRNALINADFGIWQRGNPVSIATGVAKFAADRWKVTPGTGGLAACTCTRGLATVADRLIHGSRYFLHVNQSGVGTSPYMEQRIEDVTTFAGRKVVLSFWADVASLGSGTTLDVTLEFIQNFGPAGSADVVTAGPMIQVPLAGGFARYSGVVTLPSVSGKTWNVTTAAMFDHHLAVRLKFPSGLTFAVSFAAVQLELGAVASAQQFLPEAVELNRCRRYFQTSKPCDWVSGTVGPGGDDNGAICTFASGTEARPLRTRFLVPMRKAPTITWMSPRSPFTIGNIWWNGAERAVTGTNNTQPESTGAPVIAASQALTEAEAHFDADAEL